LENVGVIEYVYGSVPPEALNWSVKVPTEAWTNEGGLKTICADAADPMKKTKRSASAPRRLHDRVPRR
jgi:hypothetical protein